MNRPVNPAAIPAVNRVANGVPAAGREAVDLPAGGDVPIRCFLGGQPLPDAATRAQL